MEVVKTNQTGRPGIRELYTASTLRFQLRMNRSKQLIDTPCLMRFGAFAVDPLSGVLAPLELRSAWTAGLEWGIDPRLRMAGPLMTTTEQEGLGVDREYLDPEEKRDWTLHSTLGPR
ncbi:uncharacterized protein N7459_008938 [Penicillium hispanicum]|uniref:uncharacterized protein n=1 Tax=Penicillium hispanicum TaxID=1080232 RepID=UPI0025402C58|nr:uncharacterized protein N7459_008938 [Penicillium hispanicum]KAJ5569508.1 hypothetical protein N7459_008938 [Penicillium hispanicum]